MRVRFVSLLAASVLGLATGLASGQAPPGAPPSPAAPPAAPAQPTAPVPVQAVPANAVAATVNGQPIHEVAVQRSLKRVPLDKQAVARPEIINFLVDNALIDQYLVRANVAVDNAAVEAKVKQIRDEIKQQGGTFEQVMKELMLTEDELRAQVVAQLRWDTFAAGQATDKGLQELFDANREIFDGTMVHARHILLMPPAGDAAAQEQAKAKLAAIKKQIEEAAAQGLAKLPPTTDTLARERARTRLIEDNFSAVAAKESACPSKAQGGDLGFFPRAGNMVEPFARAAFSLQPYQMSDVVTTQFGQHLILVTERRPGKDVKFDDIKDEVKEVFGERLRESLAAKLRPTAQLVIAPAPRP